MPEGITVVIQLIDIESDGEILGVEIAAEDYVHTLTGCPLTNL